MAICSRRKKNTCWEAGAAPLRAPGHRLSPATAHRPRLSPGRSANPVNSTVGAPPRPMPMSHCGGIRTPRMVGSGLENSSVSSVRVSPSYPDFSGCRRIFVFCGVSTERYPGFCSRLSRWAPRWEKGGVVVHLSAGLTRRNPATESSGPERCVAKSNSGWPRL